MALIDSRVKGEKERIEQELTEIFDNNKIWDFIHLAANRILEEREKAIFAERKRIIDLIKEINRIDFYHKIGRAEIWIMGNDTVCETTQEEVIKFILSKLEKGDG